MDYESIQPLLQWISDHPTWAGIAVFLISLSESLAIVGLVVPGVVMMTAIGAMMGSGVLPFWGTLTWAILGAIAGDGISYWLGYHYHEHLRDFWPFKQFPDLLKRGESFFKNHGGKSIIFGRFVGPVRPMIPVIAGMMDMTPKRFLIFNILSAIAWAPLYSLPGILIGYSVGNLSPEVAKKIVLLILLLLLILWILYMVLLKIGMWTGTAISHVLSRSWHKWQRSNRLPWLHRMLTTAQGTEEGQLGAALLFLLASALFIYTMISVMHFDGISLWNEPVYQALRALYDDKIVDFATFITGFGDSKVTLPTAAAIGIWFLWRRRYKAMFCWLGTIGAAEAIGYSLRGVVASPRPDGLMQLTHDYSFPSGHTLSATLLYGLGAAFIQHAVAPAHRWIAWAISIPLIILIALTRIYLGTHWFTDVVGGLTLGIAAVSLGILIFRRIETKIPPLRAILIPGLIMLAITMTYYTIKIYPKMRTNMVRLWPVQELEVKEWWNDKTGHYEFHRSGAIKRVATYFDIEWLGNIDKIQQILEELGFKSVPTLEVHSSLMMLSSQPKPETIPELPKFHRDRLPALRMTKGLHDSGRLLLQLWQSDYVTENGTQLWVGTLRLEDLKHPLPMVSIYLENTSTENTLKEFSHALRQIPGTEFKVHPAKVSNIREILLIKTE